MTGADAKKGKVDQQGVLNTKPSGKKGDDEFNDFTFKEGNTPVLKLQDIFIQEKGKDALAKRSEQESAGQVRVKGGAKGKKKASSKAAAKTLKAGKKSVESAGEVKKTAEKIAKYTPTKQAGKKDSPSKGKVSTKRSTSQGAKKLPVLPSPGKKSAAKTTDEMTMQQFQKYLDWHEKKKGSKVGKVSAGKKVLGQRSAAGKSSSASGKGSSKVGKKSNK